MRTKHCVIVFLLALLAATQTQAALKTQTIEYKHGDVVLEGYLAYDDAKATGKVPGVLIVHQWLGLTDYEKGRAKQLAELGYVVFALDIYGKSDRPANRGEAGKFSGKYKTDRALFRERLNLGLKQLLAQKNVDAKRVAAIGYCFGGTGVLELARSGAAIAGVVSFHGGLDSPTPADGKNIKAKILVCHGADDPFVPAEGIDAMKKEFNDAGVDWQMNYYSDAVHSFTQKMAGTDKSAGSAYNARADARSWEAMKQFFDELFAE